MATVSQLLKHYLLSQWPWLYVLYKYQLFKLQFLEPSDISKLRDIEVYLTGISVNTDCISNNSPLL